MEEGKSHHRVVQAMKGQNQPLELAFPRVGMAHVLSAENKLGMVEGQKWH